MKFSSSFLLITLLTVALLPLTKVQAANSEQPVDLVNPFIGTGDADQPGDGTGSTQPGPVVPFGMISMGPDTSEKDDVGYRYQSPRISGFTLTHLSGPGCPAGGELPFLPFAGSSTTGALRFSHATESASPGFYQVTLENGATVALTVKERVGFGQISFSKLTSGKKFGLQFFPKRKAGGGKTEGSITFATDKRHFTGAVKGGAFCGQDNSYTLYFAGELDQPAASISTTDERTKVSFNSTGASASIGLKIAISYVSVRGAQLGFASETQNETFESARAYARKLWNDALSRIRVSGGTLAQRRIFYTALYHSLLHPNIEDDVDGRYMGYDKKIHNGRAGTHYANYSGWDTYRSEVQLLAAFYPKQASNMAQSMITAADECGALPQWALNNTDTAEMLGDPGPIILASFNAFGASDFDKKSAYDYMKQQATDPDSACNGHITRPGLGEYLHRGYVSPGHAKFSAASTTLEYAASDFAIARFAAIMGDRDGAKKFMKQSASWKTLWDSSTGYIRPREDDGSWKTPFDPVKWVGFDHDTGFVEGNATQYSLMIPFDFAGVLNLMKKHGDVRKRLHAFFSEVDGGMDSPHMHIGNEPSFDLPWINLWAHDPAETQLAVHRTLVEYFKDAPGGIPGNDDLGATSSWYVWSALGLFPAIPGEGGLAIGSPLFSDIEIQLETGAKIHVRSNGPGFYVQSLSLNGQPQTRTWFEWSDLTSGADIDFTLAETPSSWGTGPKDAPPSFAPAQ